MAHDDATQSPFTRPGFIAAAAVIAFVVVFGLILVIINTTRGDDQTAPPTVATTNAGTPASTSEETPTTAAENSDSVCGLKDGDQELPVVGPEAMWAYQGTTAYPTSEEYGPGKDDPAGFRYCFQHSPLGALFFAANAVAQGGDPAVTTAWGEYAAGNGAYREELIAQGGAVSGEPNTRLIVQGFRVLDYNPEAARVDLGVRYSSDGQTTYISFVYDLVWEDGDWKISTDSPEPISGAAIPDLVGFLPWGE